MLSPKFVIYLVFLTSTLHVLPALSQCSDPDLSPCPLDDSSYSGGDDSSGGATPTLGSGIGEGFVSPAIESAAVVSILRRGADDGGSRARGAFSKLKREAALCCRPAPVQCVILENDLPACYVSFCSVFHGIHLLFATTPSAR